MASGTPTVFINYRREDTQWVASFLYDKLSSRLGRDHVFMDIDSIPFGEDWETQLRDKVASCDAMLVLIGAQWLTPKQKRRLHGPDDHLRQEIEAGLARSETRVVPLLVDGAKLPRQQDLPESLWGLLKCQATDIPRAYFAEGVERLVNALAGPTTPREEVAHQKGPGVTDPEEISTSTPPSVPPPVTARPAWLLPAAGGSLAVIAIASLAIAHFLNPPKPTTAPTPTPRAPTPTVVPTTTPSTIVLGPQTGSIDQVKDTLEGNTTGISVKDFQARVTFTNPVDTSSPWDYGLEFRRVSGNGEYRVWVDSTKHWHLRYGLSSTDISSGSARGLDTAPLGQNDLVVILGDTSGDLFVNGTWAGAFSVTHHAAGGDVYPASGFLASNITPGRIIDYKSFAVWSTTDTYYQHAGTPIRLASSGPYTWSSFLNIRDAIIAAEFVNPNAAGAWDIGYFFRMTKTDHQYAVVVSSAGWVYCYRDEGTTKAGKLRAKQLCARHVTNLKTKPGLSNDLHLYAIGSRATLFLNNRDVADWNVSASTQTGNVLLVADDLSNDSQSPVPSFKNFQVWSLDS